ncbi:hypothetical protein B9T31_09250 [Acinetobacter sp. ANC 4558]|uniref:hypothetical protein n=1 Tax=Acinetobacter sp. ANC 4558 TaxID=1977876 RepID=UPI000A334795|nr:hypothetical protein [Acinetobacter sp. ANC 4558]OTG86211.1 hypothetical protein B9T31_09250 [Acinetobacter sp. ANC 4558]
MNPDYLKFIHFQDKRLIVLFYLILFIVLGFYWKNNNYTLTVNDVWWLSGLFAIMLFNFSYELKAYWTYNFLFERVDFDVFLNQKKYSVPAFFLRPIVVSIFSILIFWIVVQGSFLFSSEYYRIIFLYLISPFVIYLIFRVLRVVYIQQLLNAVSSHIKYKSFYQYVAYSVFIIVILNLISIHPLALNPDFSLKDGYFSLALMIAMLILCSIVLCINLIFLKITKRYIFLGRIFLQELDFSFTKDIPFQILYKQHFIIRVLILFMVMCLWTISISAILSLLNWKIYFEAYFLICFIPCLVFYFLHTYWQWHRELMMAYDMYFRSREITKRRNEQ